MDREEKELEGKEVSDRASAGLRCSERWLSRLLPSVMLGGVAS